MKKTTLVKLEKSHIQEIIEKGHTFVTMPDGEVRKITVDDLIIPKNELDQVIKHKKS